MAQGAAIWGLGAVVGVAVVAWVVTLDPPPTPPPSPPPESSPFTLPDPFRPESDEGEGVAETGEPSAIDPEIAALTDAQLLERMRKELRTANDAGSYDGQFAYLVRWGPRAVGALDTIASERASDDWTPNVEAGAAIRALGDVTGPPATAVLQRLWKTSEAAPDPGYLYRDMIAGALHKQGVTAPLDRIISDLRADLKRATAEGEITLVRSRLAHRLLRAGRSVEAAREFSLMAEQDGFYWGNGHYNAACAWARARNTDRALVSLRRSFTTTGNQQPYDDVDWARKDGDLRSLHGLPEFEYLCAAMVATRTSETSVMPPERLNQVISWLAAAANGGYRITDPSDLKTHFASLQGDTTFETAWAAIGGTK